MSTQYKIGLVIEGDGKGGVRAIQTTEEALEKLEKQTKQTADEQNSLTEKGAALAGKLGAVGAAVAGASALVAGLASVIRTDAIIEIKNLSQFLNVSAESLTGWTYAAKSVGLESDKLGDIFKDVQDKIGDFVATGGGEAADIFNNLGLSVKDLKNLQPDQQLLKIAEGLDKVGTNGEKIFYMESLADEASRLLPLLANGAEGLKKMQREAELLGITLNDVEVEQVAMAGNEFKKLGSLVEGFSNQMSIQLSGAFAGMTKGLMKWLDEAGGMDQVVADAVEGSVEAIGFLMNMLSGALMPIRALNAGFWSLAEAIADAMDLSGEAVTEFVKEPIEWIFDSLGDVLTYLKDWSRTLASYMGDSGKRLSEFADSLDDLSKQAKEYTYTGEGVKTIHEKIKTSAQEARDSFVNMANARPGDEFVADFKAAQKAVEDQAKAAVESRKAHEDLGKAATAMTAEQRKAQEEAAKATEKAAKEAEKAAKEAEKAAEKQAKEAEKQAEAYAKAWEEAVNRIDEAFADGWLDVIEGNASNIFDNILDGFKRMLAEMAHAAITRPIMLNFMQSWAGGGGGLGGLMGAAGGAGGSGAGGLGGFNNLWSAGTSLGGLAGAGSAYTAAMGGGFAASVGGGIVGLGTTIGGAFGTGMASTGALLGTGSMAGISGAFANVGALASSGQILGTIGAALPMVAIAAAIAMGVDKLTGGGLFGTKFKETGKDLNLSLIGTDLSGNIVTEETRKKSLFRGKKRRYTTTALDLGEFGDTFEGIADAAVYGAERLGFSNADSTLSNFRDFTTISVKDKTEEEIQQLLSDWVTKTGDKMVGSVFGDAFKDFQVEGETLVATMMRVVNQLDFVTKGFDTVNISLEQLAGTNGLIQAKYAEDVLAEAGGSDRLNALLATYQSKFFTQQELLERALTEVGAQMQAAFSGIGFTYGDNFRAQFEAAQASGNLSAEKLVDWLEAGSIIAQFDEIAAKLAEVTGKTFEDITGNALAASKEAAEKLVDNVAKGEAGTVKDEGKEETPGPDPALAQIENLTSTLNDQFSGNNQALNSIDSRLVEVNNTLARSVSSFETSVAAAVAGTNEAVAAVSRNVEILAANLAAVQANATNSIRDLSRVVGDGFAPIYTTGPVIRTEALF